MNPPRTAADLIACLAQFDPDTPVVVPDLYHAFFERATIDRKVLHRHTDPIGIEHWFERPPASVETEAVEVVVVS